MASRFVRASKFRHVYAEPYKQEACYTSLDLSAVTGDHNYVRCGPKFFSLSVRGGGGPLLALPYSQVGKLPTGYPTINGHSSAVYDTAWCPFNDNLLATGSDDTTVKLWTIPDGGLTENLKEATTTLHGHGKPVSLLAWNPVASSVIASVGKDPCVKIWDVERGVAGTTIDGFSALVQDFTWNYNGSLLATSAKDKTAKLHDPRTGAVAQEWAPHEGSKAFKIVFLGERNELVTVGFTKQSKREFKLWDGKNFAAPLTTFELDQAAGVMLPFYDEDTRMLYLTGKGDGNVRYFEFVDEAPFVYLLSEHRTNVSTKGADMLPKRALQHSKCEVARMLKLTGDSVEPIAFVVPRKSDAFQEDIFPDTYAGKASLDSAAWFAGRNAVPKKMSLDPSKGGAVSGGGAAAAHSFAAGGGAASAAPKPAPPAPVAAPAPAPAPVAASEPAAEAAEEAAPAPAPAPTAAAPAPVAAAAEAADGGAATAELTAQVASLTDQLAAAHARIAELEAKEAKLKAALAAMA